METKIIWHFNSEKKRRGTTFAKKDEYLLALEFEPQELVDKEFKNSLYNMMQELKFALLQGG